MDSERAMLRLVVERFLAIEEKKEDRL